MKTVIRAYVFILIPSLTCLSAYGMESAAPETYPQPETTSKQLLIPAKKPWKLPSVKQKTKEILIKNKNIPRLLSAEEYAKITHATKTMSPDDRKKIINLVTKEQQEIVNTSVGLIIKKYMNPATIIKNGVEELTNDRNILKYYLATQEILKLNLLKSGNAESLFPEEKKLFNTLQQEIVIVPSFIEAINSIIKNAIQKQLFIKKELIQPISQKELDEIVSAIEFMSPEDQSDITKLVFSTQLDVVLKTINKYQNLQIFIDNEQCAVDKKILENYLIHLSKEMLPSMTDIAFNNFIEEIRTIIKRIDSIIESAQKEVSTTTSVNPVRKTVVRPQVPSSIVPNVINWGLNLERKRTPYEQLIINLPKEVVSPVPKQSPILRSNIAKKEPGSEQSQNNQSESTPTPPNPFIQVMKNILSSISQLFSGIADFFSSFFGGSSK